MDSKPENTTKPEGDKKKFYNDKGEEISKTEFKKLEKMKKNAEEKEKKEKEKKEKAAAKEVNKEIKEKIGGNEELDPTKYFENRKNWLENEIKNDKNPYPHKFNITHTIPQFRKQFTDITKKGEWIETEKISLGGRVFNIRVASQGLIFYDIFQNDTKVQLYCNKQLHKDDQKNFEDSHRNVKRGDYIGAVGFAGRTTAKGDKEGELSLQVNSLIQLSYCMHMLPKPENGLKNVETRYRQRYLDLIMNPDVKNNFVIRSKIIKYIRKFLDDRDFMEVETPMMNMIAGGAAARPFIIP